MAGGDGTTQGITFQAQVAAWLAVCMLAEVPPFRSISSTHHLTKIEVEADEPVDDIVAYANDAGVLFFNVKMTVDISDRPGSQLASVIDQFVRQYLIGAPLSGDGAYRPLDQGTDRLLLVVDARRSTSLLSASRHLFTRISNGSPLDQAGQTALERRLLVVLQTLVQRHWLSQTGSAPGDDDLRNFLPLVMIAGMDFDGGDTGRALGLLRDVVLEPTEARTSEGAWVQLVEHCLSLARTRSGGDRSVFRRALAQKGLSLRAIPTFAADVRALKNATNETLGALRHFCELPATPKCVTGESLKISRACSKTIVEHAPATSFAVIGEAGAGKSGALYEAAIELQSLGHPVLVLLVDRYPFATLPELRSPLGISNPLLDVLNAWTSEKPGILFIDALDAARGGPSERLFGDLISQVMEKVPGWKIVASIREFDLRYGERFRRLFAGEPISLDFRSGTFPGVQHIFVPRFSKEELDQVKYWSPELGQVIAAASNKLRDLLTSPFNLFLAASIIKSGRDSRSINAAETQIDLLAHYWSSRLAGQQGEQIDRESLLKVVVADMITRRELSYRHLDLPPGTGGIASAILSAGVLVPVRSGRAPDDIIQIAFAHHRLFDYAVARLFLGGGTDPHFVSHLSDESRTLLLAPGAMLALQMLWEADPTRSDFWKTTAIIASVNEHGFTRTLPARVAAELLQHENEIRPLIGLADENSDSHRAISDILSHLFGVALSGIVPSDRLVGPRAVRWSSIIRSLAENIIDLAPGPIRAILAKLVTHRSTLTVEQKKDLNIVSRELLSYAIAHHLDDEPTIVACVQGIARTFETAPLLSGEALATLLTDNRVRNHGHRELRWLAQEFDSLLENAPEILGRLYHVTYATELPSSEQRTQLGNSRILQLTSNRRQDFELAQYLLGEKVSTFIAKAPAIAIPAIVGALQNAIPLEHEFSGDVIEFQWNDRVARFQHDLSYIWWRPEQSIATKRPLLDGLVTGLVELAKITDKTPFLCGIDDIVAGNQFGAIWAAILRAALREPGSATSLKSLLTSQIILTADETRKLAADLLRVLYPLLNTQSKRDVESAVLAVENIRSREVLLAQLDFTQVILESSRDAIRQLDREGPPPENRDPYILTGGFRPYDAKSYLVEAGVDLDDEINARLTSLTEQTEIKRSSAEKLSRETLVQQWRSALQLRDDLLAHPEAPIEVVKRGWDVVAGVAFAAAEASDNPSDVHLFPGIADAIEEALRHGSPQTEPTEEEFAHSGGWGSPNPRIIAAEALMALAKAQNSVTDRQSELIRALAVDPSPAVRQQIFCRVNTLYNANPELMWELCECAFRSERNRNILPFFFSAFGHVMVARPEWAADHLNSFFESLTTSTNQDGELGRVFVSLVVSLSLWHDSERMHGLLTSWCKDPIVYHSLVSIVLITLRGALVAGDPAAPTEKQEYVRGRAREIFAAVATNCVPVYNNAVQLADNDGDALERAQISLRLLDLLAKELYFGSGAYAASNRGLNNNATVISDATTLARFLNEMAPTLSILTTVRYPSVTHNLLGTLEALIDADPRVVFDLVVDTVLLGGNSSGYQFEALGADLLIRLVRRYLADFRAILIGDSNARSKLVQVLDIFAEVGWPDARRLIYDLPEMLR